MGPLKVFIDGLDQGGAETLLVQLLPLLSSSFSKIEIHTFKGDFSLEDFFKNRFILKKHSILGLLQQMIFTRTPSYFHLGRCTLLACVVVRVKRFFGLTNPFTLHLHTTLRFHRLKEKSVSKRILDRTYLFFLKKALKSGMCKVVLSSEDHLREIESFIGKKLRLNSDVFILPNTFTRARIEELRASRSRLRAASANEITFLTFSRLDPLKQLDWAIEAVYEVAREFPNLKIRLNLFGKGPQQALLQDQINNLSPQLNFSAKLMGFAKSFVDPLAEADIYLFPSKLEGFPLSLTEAALSGILCIANDCPNGPKYLASRFSNIDLVTPPTKIQFIKSTVEAVERFKKLSHPQPVDNWPSLEELAPSLGTFLSPTIVSHFLFVLIAFPFEL